MNLTDIVSRTLSSGPWAEGENIPWDDPAVSERMLAQHLSQEHDLASCRSVKVDEQVGWIHERLRGGAPPRSLPPGTHE
jgi:hypothetical protein